MNGYGNYKIIDIGLMKIFSIVPIENNCLDYFMLSFIAPELLGPKN